MISPSHYLPSTLVQLTLAFQDHHCGQIDNTTTSRRPANVNPGCLPRYYVHQKSLYPVFSSLFSSLPYKIANRERERIEPSIARVVPRETYIQHNLYVVTSDL